MTRVLVIDDESGILDSLRILLKNEGFAPTVALGVPFCVSIMLVVDVAAKSW